MESFGLFPDDANRRDQQTLEIRGHLHTMFTRKMAIEMARVSKIKTHRG